MQQLVIEGVTLQPPTLHHRRAHGVETPAAAVDLIAADALEPLGVAVVNAVEDAQLIAGVLIRIPLPDGPEQQLDGELVIEQINVVDIGDVGTQLQRRQRWLTQRWRSRWCLWSSPVHGRWCGFRRRGGTPEADLQRQRERQGGEGHPEATPTRHNGHVLHGINAASP